MPAIQVDFTLSVLGLRCEASLGHYNYTLPSTCDRDVIAEHDMGPMRLLLEGASRAISPWTFAFGLTKVDCISGAYSSAWHRARNFKD